MDLDAYLARIGHAGPRDVNAETLRALHRAHLETVPFENLDIHLGRPIVLNEAALFEKIVGRRRGGFCFELNGLFAALLRELGFAVSLLSARVVGKDGALAPEFDHLTLLVETEGRWLADVGFGDGFTEPLCLDGAGPQRRGDSEYRLARRDGDWRMAARPPGGPWRDRYQFSLTPRRLADFTAMCDHHQTSADSHFTQSRVCSRRRDGRLLTLTDDRLVETTAAGRQEQPIADERAFGAALANDFGIEMSEVE